MIERFIGENNLRPLSNALLAQFVVNNDGEVAEAMLPKVKLREISQGEFLIKEGAHDNEMFFILSGQLSVSVKNTEVARRTAGQHVGEMALIDLKAKRSASCVALEVTVVACITERDFSELADQFPVLWRRLALALGDRLRERGSSIRLKNETPRLFIGCSVEGLDIARAIQAGLSHDSVLTQVWTDDVFKASKTTMESLVSQMDGADFSLLVLSGDDKISSRGNIFEGPRDNVIFELGLSFGAMGRDRAFFALEQGSDLKLPSDLLGTTPLQFQAGTLDDVSARVGAVCNQIRTIVKKLGPR